MAIVRIPISKFVAYLTVVLFTENAATSWARMGRIPKLGTEQLVVHPVHG